MIEALKRLFSRPDRPSGRPDPWNWQPDFTELGVRIVDVRGKPLGAYVRRVGDPLILNAPRWFNGHPGEHRIEWKCEPANCVTWGEKVYGRQNATCNSEGVFWAEATTPSGEVYSTQRCKMVVY